MSDAEAFHRVEHELPGDVERLRAVMRPGRWFLKEIAAEKAGISGHSFSARFSDLGTKLGVRTEKRHIGGRVYLYRVVPPKG